MGVKFYIDGSEPLRSGGRLERRGQVELRVDIYYPHDRTLLEDAITALDRMAAEAREELVARLETEKAKDERVKQHVQAVREAKVRTADGWGI